jgi:hypothetical protein
LLLFSLVDNVESVAADRLRLDGVSAFDEKPIVSAGHPRSTAIDN